MLKISLTAFAAVVAAALTFAAPAHAGSKAQSGIANAAAAETTEFSSHRRRYVRVYRAPRVWVAPRYGVYRPYRYYPPYPYYYQPVPVVVGYPVVYSGYGCGGCGWGGYGAFGWSRPTLGGGIWW